MTVFLNPSVAATIVASKIASKTPNEDVEGTEYHLCFKTGSEGCDSEELVEDNPIIVKVRLNSEGKIYSATIEGPFEQLLHGGDNWQGFTASIGPGGAYTIVPSETGPSMQGKEAKKEIIKILETLICEFGYIDNLPALLDKLDPKNKMLQKEVPHEDCTGTY